MPRWCGQGNNKTLLSGIAYDINLSRFFIASNYRGAFECLYPVIKNNYNFSAKRACKLRNERTHFFKILFCCTPSRWFPCRGSNQNACLSIRLIWPWNGKTGMWRHSIMPGCWRAIRVACAYVIRMAEVCHGLWWYWPGSAPVCLC